MSVFQVCERVTPKTLGASLKRFIEKKKAGQVGPVKPATLMPGDLSKLHQEVKKGR